MSRERTTQRENDQRAYRMEAKGLQSWVCGRDAQYDE